MDYGRGVSAGDFEGHVDHFGCGRFSEELAGGVARG